MSGLDPQKSVILPLKSALNRRIILRQFLLCFKVNKLFDNFVKNLKAPLNECLRIKTLFKESKMENGIHIFSGCFLKITLS